MTGDVTDDDPELARRQREKVIPITADREVLGGDVARREAQSRTTRQPRRQQAAFQESRRRPFDRELPGLYRARNAIGNDPEELDVVLVEPSVHEPPDVQHTEDIVAAQKLDAEHHLDALF